MIIADQLFRFHTSEHFDHAWLEVVKEQRLSSVREIFGKHFYHFGGSEISTVHVRTVNDHRHVPPEAVFGDQITHVVCGREHQAPVRCEHQIFVTVAGLVLLYGYLGPGRVVQDRHYVQPNAEHDADFQREEQTREKRGHAGDQVTFLRTVNRLDHSHLDHEHHRRDDDGGQTRFGYVIEMRRQEQ